MSHYTVAVFMTDESQSVDTLLAPYDENIEVAPYVWSTKTELIRRERQRLQKIFDESYSAWKRDPKGYEADADSMHIEYLKMLPELMKMTDEQLYQKIVKEREYQLNIDGDVITTYNPDSKWDWYEVGGRWSDMLIRKGTKENCDEAYVSDINFEVMQREAIAELQPYEKAMKNSSVLAKEEMREKYPTRKEYIKRKTAFSTYAVITPDGQWHAPGKMGWWAISTATLEQERAWDLNYYERFIKPALENNWYLVIVDCHI